MMGIEGREWVKEQMPVVIDFKKFQHHIEKFNAMEPERVVNAVSNADSWDWLREQIPFFECPDESVEEIYYYRWWALRKHLKRAGQYWVFSEFIELQTKSKSVPPERTISSALGHHFRETRWLRDSSYDDSYLDYWLLGNNGGPQPHLHLYSSWLQDTLWHRALVTGDFAFLEDHFDALLRDYRTWQQEHLTKDGLFWSYDVRDAMEESISGSRTVKQYRPTLNSYMVGNASALASIARRMGKEGLAVELEAEAEILRMHILSVLWNPKNQFFEVFNPENQSLAQVREGIGFIPWYFHLPDQGKGYGEAWKQLTDPEGFWASKGLTTAERRHPEFRSHGTGTCEWDGAAWPFATSQTLGALANTLRDYPADEAPVGNEDYFEAFVTYTQAQYYGGLPYIGEYYDETTGEWLKGRNPRSFYYHHSTYADLLINGLVGLCPVEDNRVVLNPLLPEDAWDWFCLDAVRYRGHILTIFWDRDGSYYGKGAGFHLWIDGISIASRTTLGEMEVQFPE